MSEYAVEALNLVKYYGKIKALDGLSFRIYPGEIYGLIGPNGAGKTTTLRIIATLIKPSSGTAKVFGHDVVDEADVVRGMISYLPEEAGAYKNLSGEEYLKFMASFYASSKDEIDGMVSEAAEISGLGSRLKDKIKTYSKGMKRRLLISRSLMIKPKLAILDEPTAGLDVLHAYHVRRIIKEYSRKYGVTILLSSHNMLEVEFLCDRVSIIHNGKLLIEGKPGELKEKFDVSNLEEVFARVTNLE
ncbi:MAG: multidrug ABC transporter ATP-binding protein [Candidatus Methanomethylicota archaeon]|uniref:Multidrug ABC transporter ATP-binding protein n=1 Tax=Thermoproteota archaeon TaxID=2056631 RepID=A0A497F4P7_9CREN|nr:MAG: multidrug ABC transporter ATP-binding protein [Candidatus Verstraetearchaeota archaeon]